VLLLTGRLDEALPDLELSRILAEQEGVDNPAVTSWRSMLASYYARQGMAKEANRLARENLKFARNFGAPWLVALALVEAAAVAQLPARPALLKEAVELAEAGSAPLVLAMAMVELGSQLRLDQDGASQARDLLRRAADIAFRSGAVALVNRAVSELRTAGARPRRLALSGYQSLTPGERRVAQLAMAGQSNAAIAEELFLSQKTVEGHLARAYRKLGIRSRQQLRAELGTDLEVADQLQA
jgi:DNA-binding CsgD family transcriptional regulator